MEWDRPIWTIRPQTILWSLGDIYICLEDTLNIGYKLTSSTMDWNGQTRTIVDATIGVTLMAKTAYVFYSLLDNIAINSYQWPSESSSTKRVVSLYEVDPITALVAQFSSLTTQISILTTQETQ